MKRLLLFMLLILAANVGAQNINVEKKVGLYMLESKIGKSDFKYCDVKPQDSLFFEKLSNDHVYVRFKNYKGWLELSDLDSLSRHTVKTTKNTSQEKSTSEIRCQATTQKGTQCKRNSSTGSSFCWQHNTSASPTTKTPRTKTTEQRTNYSSSSRCQATTKKGAQCKRTSSAGSSYCWQHQ